METGPASDTLDTLSSKFAPRRIERLIVPVMLASALALLTITALLIFAAGQSAYAATVASWTLIGAGITAAMALAQSGLCGFLLAGYWRRRKGGADPRSHASADDSRAARGGTGELREFSGHLLRRQEKERERLARELHDGLGSNLTAVAMDLEWARQRSQDNAPVAARLARAYGVLSSTVDVKRRIIADLRPTILDSLGLNSAIESHMTEFPPDGISLELDITGELPALPEAAPIALFRIFQEALNNAVRHSRAKRIRVSLRHTDGKVVLEIADDGIGIGQSGGNQDTPRFGMFEMRERAAQIGAVTEIEPAGDGHGTLVRATLALAAAEREAG